MNKRNFLFTLCVVLSLQSCSSKRGTNDQGDLVSINIIDQNGITETISNPERIKQFKTVNFMEPQPYQKVLRVYGRNDEGGVHSYLTSYHDNGQLKQYLEGQNTRAFGAYQEWYPNGYLKLHSKIIGGDADLTPTSEATWIFDGTCQAWDENGCLEAEISYCKGALEGYSTYYHLNGSIWKLIPFRNGLTEGIAEIRLDTGEVLQQSSFLAGESHGPSTRYWENGKISAQEYFNQGRLEKGEYFDLNGDLISQIEDGNGYRVLFGRRAVGELQQYHNGFQEGEIKVYAQNGFLMKKYHMKDEVRHGEEAEYFDPNIVKKANTPKLSINWYDGKIQGTAKTWYDNGVQESQRDFSNNQKNGLSTAWYRNGSLMLIEEYERDKLIKGEYYKKGDPLPISQIKDGNGTVTFFDADGNFLEKAEYVNGMPEE